MGEVTEIGTGISKGKWRRKMGESDRRLGSSRSQTFLNDFFLSFLHRVMMGENFLNVILLLGIYYVSYS